MFSEEEVARYASQIILPEVDVAGQQKFKNSKLLIIGCGGLGSVAALYLAAAGIGSLGLVDKDQLELGNLHRQIIYKTAGIGKDKVKLAAKELQEINPEIKVTSYKLNFDFNPHQKEKIQKFKDYDLILDCSDNAKTKKFSNSLAIYYRIPIIFGAAIAWSGSIFSCIPFKSACYGCIYSKITSENTCDEIGVVGPLVGIIGSLQALEGLKFLLDRASFVNKMLFIDSLHFRTQFVNLNKNPICNFCSRK